MTGPILAQFLRLFDEAFEGSDWHSLLRNLEAVTPEDWLWVPPGGRRSIAEIAGHVGACKIMYQNQAFGDASLTWDDAVVQPGVAIADIASAVAWLRAAHARLRASIAGLEDAELLRLRPHHSGKLKETRWIISVMLQHDLYHAGEINYIRALRQGNDE